MPEFEPKQFGRFFLLERLAVGGMAEIYKAKTYGVNGFEKMLAIKRILPHCSADKEFITMLIDEAKLSVVLSHANVVQVFDLGKVGDDYFIAMEFINGVNLRDIAYRCREHKIKIPTEIAVYVISEICKGLDYAHRKTDQNNQPLNIVHRDVSPQNVLISYEGEVKIVDFGIAKAAMNISHTMAGILKGKIAYMSPEQALGKAVDWRTDIFSAGILLYETLTGEKLFTGESQFEVLKKIRATKIRAEDLPNGTPEPLGLILTKALAYLPKDRYQSAGDMQTELVKYLYSSHVDFTPRKLATYVKELFADEISRQQKAFVREKEFEVKTASLNVAQEALQQDIVWKEATVVSQPQVAVKTRLGHFAWRFLKVAATLALIAGAGLSYWRFLHPRLFPPPPKPPVAGILNVVSNPTGAHIILDGRDTGRTTPAILKELKINEPHIVRLKKDLFEEMEQTLTLSSAEPVNLELALKPLEGTLDITSEPIGASIYLNGQPTGKSTPAVITGLALNTPLKVLVAKPEYKEFADAVTLTSATPQKLSVVLARKEEPAKPEPPRPEPKPEKPRPEAPRPEKPKPVKPETPKPEAPPPEPEPATKIAGEPAALKIDSDPSGAEVFIDGEYKGSTPLTVAGIQPGSVNVLVDKPDKLRFSKKLRLEPGETKNLGTIRLEELYGEVIITTMPARAGVIFNGDDIGAKTPVTIKKVRRDKQHTIRLVLEGYKTWERTFGLKDGTSKKFNIILEEE